MRRAGHAAILRLVTGTEAAELATAAATRGPGTAMTPSASARTARTGRGYVLLGGLVLGAAALVAVHLALLDTYWDYSEGVYALSAHMMLHGIALYSGIVGAQPPGVFLTGVVLLAIHDGLEWLRFGVACLQLGAGLIAAQIVLRITGNRLASILTPAAMLLTPWAVHEHGALTPELAALPVLMGAALLSTEERYAPLAGLLCGLLPIFKLPFARSLSSSVRRFAFEISERRWPLLAC